MAERDAFGNEISEDPLKGLGWSAGGTPVPSSGPPAKAAPAVSAGTSAAPAPVSQASVNTAFGAPTRDTGDLLTPLPGGIPRVRRSPLRLIGALVKIGIPLAIFVVIGTTIAGLGNSVSDSVDDVRRAISTSFSIPTAATTPSLPGTEAPGAPRTPPVGFGKGSLLRTGNFRPAMDLISREGSRLRTLRVSADRVDATIVTNAGRMKQVQVTWDGRVDRRTFGSGFPQTGTFPVTGIRRSAPFRLARSAAGRTKSSPSAVDYVVAISLGPGGEQQWTVILKNGKGQYLADNRGRITRRIN